MATRSWSRCAAVVVALGMSLAAHAISLSPTSVTIEGDGPRVVRVRVTAPEASDLALDLQLLERHADGPGERRAPPVDAAFELHPPQLLVPAGGSADIVLRWVGTAARGSRSFHLVADQLPIMPEADGGSGEVQVLARIHLPVHVAGDGVPELHATAEGEGPSRRVMLSNRGSRYARLAMLELRVRRADATTRVLPGSELARLIGSDALLPGASPVLDARVLGLRADEQILGLAERE